MNDADERVRERNIQRILAKLQEQIRDRLEDTAEDQPGSRAALIRLALMIDQLAQIQERQADEEKPAQ